MSKLCLEDYEGFYATEFHLGDTQVNITCTRDFENYRKITIRRNNPDDEEELKTETMWLTLRLWSYDGHDCLGELEVIEEEDGIIYIDSDFGAFRIHSNNSIPPLKKNA